MISSEGGCQLPFRNKIFELKSLALESFQLQKCYEKKFKYITLHFYKDPNLYALPKSPISESFSCVAC